MTPLTPEVSQRDHVQGAPDAPVTLVLYGNFGGLHCARAKVAVGRLQRQVGDQMRFVFRNLPLAQQHDHAMAAACFAEAAGLQGLYWPTHDWLFRRQESLHPHGLELAARSLHLDWEQMGRDHLAARLRVEDDLASAQCSGAEDAPTFFINGHLFRGPRDTLSLLDAVGEAARHAARGHDHGSPAVPWNSRRMPG